jgi:hypothetical protein
MRARFLAAAAGLALGALAMTGEASADVRVGVDIGVAVGDPYYHDGYHSDRWYYDYDEPPGRRVGHRKWHKRYHGYDCHRGWHYGWHRGRRVKYESWWCFDERGRRYEADGTRVVIYID